MQYSYDFIKFYHMKHDNVI